MKPIPPRSHPLLLISPNAFKGTLSPSEAGGIMEAVLRKDRPWCRTHILPLADGGDGTLDVLMTVFRGKIQKTRVTGPMGRSVWAEWGVVRRPGDRFSTAVIEMARASGLALVRGKKRILEATSTGTGQLIMAALNRGCRSIVIGVGGTASSDGGAGALEALGIRYFDKDGNRLSSRPKDLIALARVDWRRFDRRLKRTRIVVLCDVTNPLLGPSGSAFTFGPQKGASPREVIFLERFLAHWAKFTRNQTKSKKGAGAAGALAFGLSGFAGARLVPGAPYIMRMTGWDAWVRKATGILTGEGRLDETSFGGKVIGTIVRRRGRAAVGVICGSSSLSRQVLRRRGIAAVVSCGPAGLDRPRRFLAAATRRLLASGFAC